MRISLFAACLMVAGISAIAAERGVCPVDYDIDEKTGGILRLCTRDGRRSVQTVEMCYSVLSKSGDLEALEREDVVVDSRITKDSRVFRCSNPKMPGIDIFKRYHILNGGLRRTVSFLNANVETKYVTPFVECRFSWEFLDRAYHLGAGYIGPYKPFPHVDAPRQVTEYLQSSKGMVLTDPTSGKGSRYHPGGHGEP